MYHKAWGTTSMSSSSKRYESYTDMQSLNVYSPN